MMGDSGGLQQAKLVLLGDMGAGKSSLVLRFVKGKFFDYQVSPLACCYSPHTYTHAAKSVGQDRPVITCSDV